MSDEREPYDDPYEDGDYSDPDTIVGTCPCGGEVYERVTPGARPFMARFQDPDDIEWLCRSCGREVDEDELRKEDDGAQAGVGCQVVDAT